MTISIPQYILTEASIDTLTEESALDLLRRQSYGEGDAAAIIACLPEDLPEDWAQSMGAMRVYIVMPCGTRVREVACLRYDASTEWEDGQDWDSLREQLVADVRDLA